jgi:pimeloyl-ACP methyl ester carboxylesterase
VIEFLQQQGFKQFYLIGHSSGANKICVYDHYQPDNPVDKYILLGGGDDTGIFFEMMGGDRDQFFKYLKQAKEKIKQGQGRELVPEEIIEYILSYHSFYDICNPDGDYNTFPFREYLQDLNLSTKPLFRYFKQISKPSLVVYGENDEYAPDESGAKANQILQKHVNGQNNFDFEVLSQADHSFHYREKELAQLISAWLKA